MPSTEEPLAVLNRVFGYREFRSSQHEVINALLDGEDALVLMPTGGGKSLCYQLPALLLDGVTVVISPLIALMEDQVSTARQLGIAAGYLNSSQSSHDREVVRRELRDGNLKLLYLAPERLQLEDTLDMLREARLSLVAVDEAHCVSQWGHNFRPDYLELAVFKSEFPNVPLIALTATANEMTRQEILEKLAITDAHVFVKGFDRPNIYYQVQQKRSARKQLEAFLQSHQDESGIVYCLSRKKVEQTAAWLQSIGHQALPYHAGLPAEMRKDHQQRFLAEDAVIIVATIAFGMGIDKPDVRFVAHLDLPKSIEAYYQETGRAGRDGKPADAWMVYGLQDVVLQMQMVRDNTDERQTRIEQHKLNTMLAFCEVTDCRRQVLLNYFGEGHSGNCGQCDNCISPKTTYDATVPVQKLLSAVYRTGQRFGAAYVIDVLTGKQDERISRFGHDRLSVYGIGDEMGATEWRGVVRQLIVMGLVDVDVAGYGGLRLTESSRAVLKGDREVRLSQDVVQPSSSKRRADRKGAVDEVEVTEADHPLLEQLRALRREIADEENIAPFMVLHDRSLRELAVHRPSDRVSLLHIHGIGEGKADRFGARLLDVIERNPID